MSVLGWALWGFIGTLVLSTLAATSQGLGLTRMNIPYMLGTIFTPQRDRAKVIGLGVHLFNGWLFALGYIAAFHALGRATWWIGALFGLLHALFVLTVGMRLLPGCTRAWRAKSTARRWRASSSRPVSSRSTTACARRSR